ncbi:hypothetical protein [Chitinophaga tropicalis]|uniref:Uncharacterized protein n=1 Tax=Chitinophaga tropicalis TaxID=2683588 RepID=A0A7K1U7S0_9BACT|nr:hypothetical protein [Chitinophaga tropicalis]MVT10392.1 hypothetical protein [Chitinophaga tropicalis]
MVAREIIIRGSSSNVLNVQLLDILRCIDEGETVWSLLWIRAVGSKDNSNVLEYEELVNASLAGVVLSWQDLLALANQFDQIIEVLICGSENKGVLRRFSTDDEMVRNCEYVIELVDSSYWLINSKDHEVIEKMLKSLDGAEFSLPGE